MIPVKLMLWSSFGTLFLISSHFAFAQAGGPPSGYADIPAGFDFPGDKTLLGQYRSQPNIPAQRIHVWNVFSGMTTEAAGSKCATPTQKCATFETWFSEDETFASGATAALERPHFPSFHLPNQFRSRSSDAHIVEQVKTDAAGSAVLSFVMYNYAAFNHIRTNHLYQASVLNSIATGGPPDRTIPQNRMIPALPPGSVVLKLVWWPVAKDKISAMPIWDPEINPALPNGNPPSTWARYVGVDPTRASVPAGETGDIVYGGQVKHGSHIVSLGQFHSIVLDASQAAGINSDGLLASVAQQAFGRPVAAGDYAVLVATHLTTKEIDDWVWATFWWHDKPNDGSFAANRVDSIIGVWRNFLMNASYDLYLPAEPDQGPHSTFNPWLEAKFPNGGHGGGGTFSNCMNCHNRASFPPRSDGPNGQDFLPIFRGNPDLSSDSAYAAGRLRTDFLWSIPDQAQ